MTSEILVTSMKINTIFLKVIIRMKNGEKEFKSRGWEVSEKEKGSKIRAVRIMHPLPKMNINFSYCKYVLMKNLLYIFN